MAIDSKTRNNLRHSGKAAIDPDAGPHEAWRAIDAANRIFGADGWTRELVEMRCAATREREGLVTTAYVAKVRVSLTGDSNGGFRDAQGCGEGKGATPFEAHNKGLKAAELDATVRALAAFGRPFGTMRLAGHSANRRRPQKSASIAGKVGSSGDSPQIGDGCSCSSVETLTPTIGADERQVVANESEKTPSSEAHLPSHPDGDNGSDSRFDDAEAGPKRARSSSGTSLSAEDPSTEDSNHGAPTSASGKAGLVNGTPTNIVRARDLLPTLNQGSGLLLLPKQRRLRVPAHLAYVRGEPCLICGRQPCDAHHLRFTQPRAMAKKVSDEFTVPLCRRHHDLLHRDPDEAEWWAAHGVDPIEAAEQLWKESQETAGA
jgi:hypothetical protein